ncbi:MAG TPA: CHASE domain-containing protein [Steroidobacteraceae bacterium]|nr:CHASE domain-containing protein [Steroidobacteraceae bacterium]
MTLRRPQDDQHVRLAWVLVLAGAYWIAGKLGLLLAIPPGYATAIWPPSGIALGCLLLWGPRYWPGVLLGSVLTNLSTSLDRTSADTILQSVMISTAIGAGAALQAAVGATILRRHVDARLSLMRERDLLAFFLLGGPFTHVINASLGTSALLIAGAIPVTAWNHTWWTWWVGDSIGALIFAPLVIMWLSNDPVWTTRRSLVTMPLAATFCAAIFVFVYTSRTELEQLQRRFNEDTAEMSNAIAEHINLNIESLHSVGALFAVDGNVDEVMFDKFTGPILARHVELQAIGWAPRIDDAGRPAFEAELRRANAKHSIAGHSEIFERKDSQNVSAGVRAEYFPVRFVAPLATNHDVIAFDVASEKRRHDALIAAALDNQVAATEPIELIQIRNSNGLLLTLPVYANNESRVRGYVTAVFAMSQLMEAALHSKPMSGIVALSIDDVTNGSDPVHAYKSKVTQDTGPLAAQLRFTTKIRLGVANRTWVLSFTPTLDYLAARQGPGAWLVLAGGMLFTALIAAGALLVTGRAQAIETLVSQRTTELAQINEKLAEEICDHLRTEHKLAAERELLRTVLNNLHEGIIVLDADGELKMANGAAHRMLHDITGDELGSLLKPRTFTLYAADGTTQLQRSQTPHWCALHGQTVRDFEMVAKRHGRTALTLIVNAQPLLAGDNNGQGAIVVMRDVTDTKKVDKLKAEFVATVSHELRTPITSIRGSLGLIAGGVSGPLSDKTRNLVEIALRNSDRLAHLINDLLDIEKMESGKMQFELQRHSLTTLIEQAVEANNGYAQNLNVRYVVRRPLPNIAVTVDSFRLVQVLSNLLSNAAKFSPAQSVVEIAIVTAQRGPLELARVSVSDHGPGIPDEFKDRMFQKFSQADSSDNRAKSGTGLGLAICKSIMEQMGGDIGYETEVGHGTTFYFELPLADDPVNLVTAAL